jgi:hypothetical protein
LILAALLNCSDVRFVNEFMAAIESPYPVNVTQNIHNFADDPPKRGVTNYGLCV